MPRSALFNKLNVSNQLTKRWKLNFYILEKNTYIFPYEIVESALESSSSEREFLVVGDDPPSMSLNLRAEGQVSFVWLNKRIQGAYPQRSCCICHRYEAAAHGIWSSFLTHPFHETVGELSKVMWHPWCHQSIVWMFTENTWAPGGHWVGCEPAMCPSHPGGKGMSWAALEVLGAAGRGLFPSTQHWCPVQGFSVPEGHGQTAESPTKDPWGDSDSGASLMGKGWEICDRLALRREGSRGILSIPKSLKGEYKGSRARLLSVASSERTRGQVHPPIHRSSSK